MHKAGRIVATHLPANTVKPRTAIFCSSVFMRVMSDVAVQCQSDHRYNDSKPPLQAACSYTASHSQS